MFNNISSTIYNAVTINTYYYAQTHFKRMNTKQFITKNIVLDPLLSEHSFLSVICHIYHLYPIPQYKKYEYTMWVYYMGILYGYTKVLFK